MKMIVWRHRTDEDYKTQINFLPYSNKGVVERKFQGINLRAIISADEKEMSWDVDDAYGQNEVTPKF